MTVKGIKTILGHTLTAITIQPLKEMNKLRLIDPTSKGDIMNVEIPWYNTDWKHLGSTPITTRQFKIKRRVYELLMYRQ